MRNALATNNFFRFPRVRKTTLVGLGCALLLTLPAVNAQSNGADKTGKIYSWTDAKGQRHYGDAYSAPAGAARMNVHVKNPTKGLPTAATGTDGDASNLTTPDKASAEESNACRVAKGNQALLADPGKDVLSEDGKTVLNKEARAQSLEVAAKRVEAYCNVLGNDK